MISEELVAAAAWVSCLDRHPILGAGTFRPCADCRVAARIAIEAFLAALPEMPKPNCYWCIGPRKLCLHHEGFADGWEALLSAMGAP